MVAALPTIAEPLHEAEEDQAATIRNVFVTRLKGGSSRGRPALRHGAGDVDSGVQPAFRDTAIGGRGSAAGCLGVQAGAVAEGVQP